MATIPPDLLVALNGEASSTVLLESIQIFLPTDWLDAIDHGIVTKQGKQRLADACVEYQEYLPVARRLLEQAGFGYTLAREVVADDNWDQFQRLVTEARLNEAKTKDEIVRSLGPLLVNRHLLLWSFRIVLSTATVRAIADLFRDPDAEVRRSILRAFDSYDISLIEADLVYALDDTNEEVRNEALRILKAKVPPERLETIAAEALDEARTVRDLAQQARAALFSLPTNIPGLDRVLGLFRGIAAMSAAGLGTAAEAIGDVATKTTDAARATSTSLVAAWRSLRNSKSRRKGEDPNALFALCVAVAWADGTIIEHEQGVLRTLLLNEKLNPALEKWLTERPGLQELGPFLKKLSDPERAAKELAANLELGSSAENAAAWLREIEELLGIHGILISSDQ